MVGKQSRQRMIVMVMIMFMTVFAGWQPAAAGQRVPLLHWYNVDSGISAVGYIGNNDRFIQLPEPGNFMAGWTHTVHLSDYYIFVYNANNGAGATVWLNNAGQYTTVALYEPGSFTTGWTTIVNVGGNRLFFYRASDGLAALAAVNDNGQVDTLRSYNNLFSRGWSQIVYTGATGIFFYNQTTGTGEVGYLDQQGTYHLKKLHQNYFSTGWTHIVYYFSTQTLVYYNQWRGTLAIGQLGNAGNHVTLKSYTYKSGWTAVVAMHGELLFYNAINGAGALGEVEQDGRFSPRSWSAGTFATGWTSIVYGF